MTIQVAKTAGFCFGVRNALELVEKRAAEKNGKTLYTIGPLIHNPDVVARLEGQGVKTVADVSELGAGDEAAIRAHGVGEAVYRRLEEQQVDILDATCPYVKKIHNIVREESLAGCPVIILGNPEHPEVKGIQGWCQNDCFIIQSEEDFGKLPQRKEQEICLVAQTTFNIFKFQKIVEKLREIGYNLRVFPTICKSTHEHQQEAIDLAEQVDVMIVIGGKHSSNTRKLYELCLQRCPKALYIENAQELSPEEIRSMKMEKVGITAGASTPNFIMQEVIRKMSEINTFEELLNESFKEVHSRDIVTGTVVQVTDSEIVLNIGYKCDGTMTREEYGGTDAPLTEQVKVGDVMEVLVVKVGDSEILLSRRRLLQDKTYAELEEAFETKAILTGTVQEAFDNGVTVQYKGSKVFIPASLADVRRVDLKTLVGQEVQFRIIRLQRKRNRILGDRRSVLLEELNEKREETLKKLEIGARVNGVVKTLTNYCAFVDLGGIDGMLHISEMGWSVVRHPAHVLKEGQQIEVMIKDMDLENRKISLSTKFPETNPWNGAEEKYAVGSIVEGTVVRFADFGAFVELEKGVDALIHISHLSRKFVKQPSDVLTIGERIQAKIIDLDLEQKRISLSLRDLEPEDEAVEIVENPEPEEITEEQE
ncbi:bifunctional 4-hydroxy-3-methylbut-2-enyl diphosphate reductase/30S ribosomal protein S1 [Bianquea renquensis]|uniref:4-hydroxy-3-methylbut-2-enyl diphosphate reductase n=1 Tax=Bianquea renquensis TaxID=2763661 RepID=A0A926DSL1_9FIRM|nr:bifunctional 4-hydroxy-3-methylbut-2-enyl diphosphate reductase/30S ribosomal protein S1 [Bianquea renquensis]MBC8543009.1 bifunctional 4-hydroxy-3-methylbut-2-enyl diphosphate reductase/30S ribosomal protein S1 [Bianquea renquensis]